MLRSDSSYLHVIDRPIAFGAELSQSMAEPLEEPFEIWHILYLGSCKRKNHQQIVGISLMAELL
jgi:hypothetical protein